MTLSGLLSGCPRSNPVSSSVYSPPNPHSYSPPIPLAVVFAPPSRALHLTPHHHRRPHEYVPDMSIHSIMCGWVFLFSGGLPSKRAVRVVSQ